MIRDLDLTLKSLLTGEAEPGSELKKANISFCVPDEEWQKKGNKLDLNVYLYDIRENRELRTNERHLERTVGGRVIQKKPPPRLDCAYLITAWNKATSSSEDQELQEHRLLSQVLHVLLKNHRIPPDYLQGFLLEGQEPALPMISAQPGRLTDPVEFWGTLNTPLRPTVSCIVTVSLDLEETVESAMVISKITDYQQYDNPEIRKRVIQVGGRITDEADPAQGIGGAWVTLMELDRTTTTDPKGYYTFPHLSTGRFTFRAKAPGYKGRRVKIRVPAPKGKNYDISLSKK